MLFLGELYRKLKWEGHCIFVQLLKCLYKCSKTLATIRFVGAQNTVKTFLTVKCKRFYVRPKRKNSVFVKGQSSYVSVHLMKREINHSAYNNNAYIKQWQLFFIQKYKSQTTKSLVFAVK